MTSTLSASTITSESYDPDYSVHDDCTSLDEEASVSSTRKLDDSRLNMHAPHSYITSLADCPTVMRVVLFVTLCILLSYVSISHRNALFDSEELLNMF